MSTTTNLTTKDLTGHPAPESGALVLQMLKHLGFVGDFRLSVGWRMKGRPGHRGVEIRSHDLSGVVIAVQHGGNDTRHECRLTQAGGFKQADFHAALVKGLGGNAFRPDEPPKAPVIPIKSAETQKGETAKAPVSTLQSSKLPIAPSEEESDVLLRGFTKSETNLILLLDLIRGKHGKGDFSRERIGALMRENGLCAKETSNGSIGQIIKWLTDAGYFEFLTSRNNIDFFRIGVRGDELLVENMKEAEASKPKMVHGLSSMFDPVKIQAGMQKLLETISKVDAAVKELQGVEEAIQACNERIAELKAQIDPVLARRDGFEKRKLELRRIMDDPTLVAAREELAQAQAALETLAKFANVA